MAHILVVGAAGGVGSAIAAKLAERGDRISASVLNDQEEAQVRKALPGADPIIHLDLQKAESVRDRLSDVLRNVDDLDAVIVCAAISPYGPVETTPIEVVRKTFEINCLSDIAIYQAAMPALRKTRGRIIFISSMAGRTGMPFIGAYTASKYALEGAGDVMRQEAKPQGVDVVLVEPGGIRTPMVANQLSTIEEDIAALQGEIGERYGYLYRGFRALASQSYQNDASTADQVADVVTEALDAGRPAARYIAGRDAEQLIGLARQSSGEELDNVFAQMFATATAGKAQ